MNFNSESYETLKVILGAREMALQLKSTGCSCRGPGFLPATIWQLTTAIYNSSCRESNALFWKNTQTKHKNKSLKVMLEGRKS